MQRVVQHQDIGPRVLRLLDRGRGGVRTAITTVLNDTEIVSHILNFLDEDAEKDDGVNI